MTIFWIETAVATLIVALFLLWAIVFVKPDQVLGRSRARIVVGAAFEGVIVGGLVGFVLLPGWVSLQPFALRPAEEVMTWRVQAVLVPAFLASEIVRNGGLTNVPGLSYFLQPRRRAVLVRRKIALEKQLAKLDAALTREQARAATPQTDV